MSINAGVASPIARLVAAATSRFGLTDAQHSVASGLGLWLLLAITAPAARGEAREQLKDVLGCPSEEAAGYASLLLSSPSRAVNCALAAWSADQVRSIPAYGEWAGGFPAAVQRGPIPDQASADAWASENTHGIIDRFPLEMSPATVLVLASALATKVAWQHPFSVVESRLLDGPWGTRVRWVLSSHPEHPAGLALTSAGVVGWHSAEADGLRVVSVLGSIGASPERVLQAAHEIALNGAAPASLFDLPLGVNDFGLLSEWHGRPGPEQVVTATLPAWSAAADIPLMDRPGMSAARTTLAELSGAAEMDARQIALARFTKEGFEAAAVSGMRVRVSRRAGPPTRRLQLRFGRPYAAVAIATGASPWNGVPVFAAWVTEPSEAG